MKYVEFFDNSQSQGKGKRLGEIRVERGKLTISDELIPFWDRAWSYQLLGGEGYDTMYDPEKILEALPRKFKDPKFQASEVKTR